MNLNILTSGLITSKFGIRPALMCATRTDLSQHSVVRIISAKASGWIGIANGNLITGAKCQSGDTTLNGFEALSIFMKLESGAFDLIQMDSRLLGDELAQSIGISIDELLDKLRQTPDLPTIEILRKCKRNTIPEIDSKLPAPPTKATPSAGDELDILIASIDDADWDLGPEGVIESLEKQTSTESAPKVEEKVAPKVEEKVAPKVEEKVAPKVEEKVAPKVEEKVAPKVEEKVAPKVEEKVAPKVEEKVAPKVEEKVAPKVEGKVAPKVAKAEPPVRDKTADLFAPDESQTNKAISEPFTKTAEIAPAAESTQSQTNKAFDVAQSQTNKALDTTLSQTNKAMEEQTGSSLLDGLAQVWGWAKKTTVEVMKADKEKKSTKEVETPKISWEPSLTETSVKRADDLAPTGSGETVVVKRTQEPIELTPVAKRKTSEVALPSENVAATPPSAEPVDEELARYGELAAMQEAAFGNSSLEVAPEANNAGFVLVSPGDNAYSTSSYQPPESYVPEAASSDGDPLGMALRAELKAFVRQKFGEGDEKVFEDVNLEDTKDYQQSLVLRDLEAAISGKPKNELVKVEREEEPEPTPGPIHQSTFDKLKSQALTQSMQTSQLTSEIQRAKSGAMNASGNAAAPSGQSSKIEQEREQSRSLFVEQVRKSVEVDAKSFVANQIEDTKLEISILKDKRLKHFIIVGSSVGIVLSIIFFTFHSAQRQTSLTAASDKLVGGDLKGAKESYEAIIAANPQSWEAYLGHALSVPTDYKRQVEDYKKVLSIKPEEFSAAQSLAKAYLELKNYGEAIEAADKAIKIKDNVNSLMIKADALMKLSRWDTAAQVLELASKREDGDKARIFSLLADCYDATNDKDKQANALVKALACDPKNVDFAKKLAILKIAQGETAKGRDYLNKALVLSPGDGELHFQNALLLKEKDPDKAIDELTKAIEHNFATPEAFAERGLLYFQKKQYGPAKPDLEEAVSKKPLAKLQKALDQTDKAIALMKSRAGTRTLKDESGEDTPLTAADLAGDYVGRAYEQAKAGNLGYAIRVLRAAVKTNPSDGRARRYLANALYSAGEYVGASTQFAYAANQGLSLEEQYYYGRALVKANRLEAAVKVLQNLVQQQPAFTKARIELIKAYTLAGFNDHAREECQIGMQSARNQQEYAEFKSMMP